MKIIFIDTFYPNFLKNVRHKYPNLKKISYDSQLNFLLDQSFGTSGFSAYNLRKLGWQSGVIVANDEILQKRWAKEKGLKVKGNRLLSKLQTLPYSYKILGRPEWTQQIALEQIKHERPDVVYCHDLSVLNTETLKEVKKYSRLLVGQIASPLPSDEYLRQYGLIISSFPHFVKKFRKMGINSEYQKLAFESGILEKVSEQERKYDITFVGSFSPYHQKGTKFLEEVARHYPIHVWGHGLEFLSPLSPLRKNFHGQAWGLNMFKIFAQSKIVINRHIGVSGNYANNMRLYEATGMGAMLITDKKKNLNDLFKVGKEVVKYKNAKDLKEKIDYFIKNDEERKKTAEAGQKRTLKDHNYKVRMEELMSIIGKYLK
jgi:glycosyltransferase involved in cell wall biosynthesis